MNKRQLNATLDKLKAEALRVVKLSAPVRTGNLQDAVKVRDLPNGGFEVYIDTGQAPYAPFTIEPWTHGQWNGRANPNEGWFDEAIDEFVRRTKLQLKGQIISKGVNKNA